MSALVCFTCVAQVGLGFDVDFTAIAIFFCLGMVWFVAALAGFFWSLDLFLARRRYSIRELFKLTTYWSVLIAWGVFLFR